MWSTLAGPEYLLWVIWILFLPFYISPIIALTYFSVFPARLLIICCVMNESRENQYSISISRRTGKLLLLPLGWPIREVWSLVEGLEIEIERNLLLIHTIHRTYTSKQHPSISIPHFVLYDVYQYLVYPGIPESGILLVYFWVNS